MPGPVWRTACFATRPVGARVPRAIGSWRGSRRYGLAAAKTRPRVLSSCWSLPCSETTVRRSYGSAGPARILRGGPGARTPPPGGRGLHGGCRRSTKHIADFARSRDHVIHIPGERPRLLRGVRQIAQHRRHAGRPQPQQIKPNVLHRQDARLDLLFDALAARQEIAQRLVLSLEQVELTFALRSFFMT